jgi:6-phosphofructokinase
MIGFSSLNGRGTGYIALHSVATGAENILIPERKTDIEELVKSLLEKEKEKTGKPGSGSGRGRIWRR